MAIIKEPETKGTKKPILFKGTSQSLCLAVKVGDLGLELWNFPHGEAQPYARLILEQDRDERDDARAEGEKEEWSVTLAWQEACAVSGAIQDWLSFLESGIEEHHEPALHMELASLMLDFYRQGSGQGPRMVCTVETKGSVPRQVILNRSEASLFGRLLFCQEDDVTDQPG